MDISVGDFAEQILAQTQREAQGLPPDPSFQPDESVLSNHLTDQVDISNVEVPDNFVTNLVEQKEVVAELPNPVPSSLFPEGIEGRQTEDLTALIQEVKQLLVQVKEVLTEMTTVGGIGVRTTSPGDRIVRKGKETDPKDKEEDEEDPMDALLTRVRKKRKSRTA